MNMEEEKEAALAAVQTMAATAAAIRRTTEAGNTTTTTSITTNSNSVKQNDWEEELKKMGASDFLRQYLVDLTDAVEPKDFSRELQQDGILTARDVEVINNKHTPRMDRAGQLINVVSRKGPAAVRAFMEILGHKYPYVFTKITRQKPPSLPAPVLRDSTIMLRDSGCMVSEALRHLTTVVEGKVHELQKSLVERTKENSELEKRLRAEKEAAWDCRTRFLEEKEERLKVMEEVKNIKKQNKEYAERIRNMHLQLEEMKKNLANGSNRDLDQIEPEQKRRSIKEIEKKSKEVFDTLEKLENSAEDMDHLQRSLQESKKTRKWSEDNRESTEKDIDDREMLEKDDELCTNTYLMEVVGKHSKVSKGSSNLLLVRRGTGDDRECDAVSIDPRDGRPPTRSGDVTTLTRQNAKKIKDPTAVKREISREEAPQPVYESVVPCKALYPKPVFFLGERPLCERIGEDLASLESDDFRMSEAPADVLVNQPGQLLAFADNIKQDPHHKILRQIDWATIQSLRKVKIFPIFIVVKRCIEDNLTKEMEDIRANLRPDEYVCTFDLDLNKIKDKIKDMQGHLVWIKDPCQQPPATVDIY